MSEIRILNLCHKKSILVDIYRQSLLMFWNVSLRILNAVLQTTEYQALLSGF